MHDDPNSEIKAAFNKDASGTSKPKINQDIKRDRPKRIHVPRGPMANGRITIDRYVREEEAMRRSREKFEKKRTNQVQLKTLKEKFNDRGFER